MEKTNTEDLPRITIRNGEVMYTGIIVGNDPDIGITIVNEEDPDDFILCFRTPMMLSKLYPDQYISSPARDVQARETYDYLSACLAEGHLDLNRPTPYGNGNGPSASACAFNQ